MLASQAEAQGRELIFRVPLFRVQRGLQVAFTGQRPSQKASKPSKVALALAMGHRYRRAVETGEVPDFAALAWRLKTSRAWVSMRVELTFLAPRIQEYLVSGSPKALPIQELVHLARLKDWREQLQRWQELLSKA